MSHVSHGLVFLLFYFHYFLFSCLARSLCIKKDDTRAFLKSKHLERPLVVCCGTGSSWITAHQVRPGLKTQITPGIYWSGPIKDNLALVFAGWEEVNTQQPSLCQRTCPTAPRELRLCLTDPLYGFQFIVIHYVPLSEHCLSSSRVIFILFYSGVLSFVFKLFSGPLPWICLRPVGFVWLIQMDFLALTMSASHHL